MNVLAIETSSQIGSVAACNDDGAIAEESFERGMEHGRMLVALIDRVVAGAGWNKRADIHLISVSLGPGSFTGLRVGVTCAKTMAVFLHQPVIGVCSFDGMAENAPQECERVLTVLDARRGQVYAAAYERRNRRLVRLHDPAVMAPGAAAGLLPKPYLAMGDALEQYADALCAGGAEAADSEYWRIHAKVIGRLGLEAFRAGRRDDALALAPIYLRLPEAEEKRLARERAGS